MISEPPAITQVQAVYSFKGKNNDELNFKKGDIITITQKEEGGWWEGTFEGKTGWFPSNYVKDIGIIGAKPPQTIFAVETVPEQQTVNRNLILKDIIDSEKSYISEMQTLLKTVLTPLGNSDILTADEYSKIVRNLPEIVDLHATFNRLLEDCYEKSSLEQRVGSIFLSMAEKIKSAHTEYCSNHPRTVCILENYKEKLGSFVEGLGGRSPGLVFLTAGLSRPFRRLERYGGCLQELERHMEEFHPDRGDTQRSVFVYQNLASHCASVRRQKEQELEVLCGSVRCWEGDEPQRLGELIYMGPVKITTTTPITETKDRHLVLFSQCVILLSVSQRLSAFVFEKKYNLSGMSLNIQEDSETSRSLTFELLVSGSERIIVSCPSKEERLRLMELLQKQIRNPTISSSSSSAVSCTPLQNVPPSTSIQSVHQKQADAIRTSSALTSRGSTPVVARPPVQHTLSGPAGSQQYHQNQHFSLASASNPTINNRVWTYSSLRPSLPITTRPCQERTNKRVINKSFKKRELNYDDDSQLLKLVEAYCSLTARSRQTVKSALLESPQVLIAEEEKIIVEEVQGTRTVVEERSLVDTVYALRDQVRELQNQVTSLAKEVELLKNVLP
ncbi:rho guanine nucleotide exchange factor 7-like isoform X1 [Daphnia pulex]|uniref:rho guanine nucleotide exchange factor 7-like isoform X1 n=1 Tax=Daphnia pulex TaxID=6669 RepID=UPI001EDF74C0|nr:rho guanine nucleotide exchange factor 7-like isoform X1 [Daphnia pulex]